jgi:hypothetical protein
MSFIDIIYAYRNTANGSASEIISSQHTVELTEKMQEAKATITLLIWTVSIMECRKRH